MPDSAQVSVEVPAELNNLSVFVQGMIKSLRGGQTWVQALGQALPVLFAEGAKWEEIKAELSSSRAIPLAGLFVGEVIAALVEKQLAAKRALAARDEAKEAKEPQGDCAPKA